MQTLDRVAQVALAARGEKIAGATRKEAEAAYRTSWWGLTMQLALAEDGAELKAAYDAAESELGCTRSYLGSRRKTGRVVAQLEVAPEDVAKFPPRIAMAWACDLKRGPEGMIEALDKAREDELSMRGFIEANGGVPMSTGKERFQPSAGAETEQQVADALGNMTDDQLEELAMRNPRVASAITRGASRAGDSAREQFDGERGRPTAKPGDDLDEFLAMCRRGAKTRLSMLVGRDDLPVNLRHAVKRELSELTDTLGWVEAWADSGDLTINLEHFLAEEDQ